MQGLVKALIFFCLYFSVFTSTWAQGNSQKWNCEPNSWKQEPSLSDGIFSATVQTRCTIQENRANGIAWLYERLQQEYRRADKYIVHTGPTPIKKGLLDGVYYDLTDKVSESGNDLAIRQDVNLWKSEPKQLFYETVSKEIQATGTAAYLRQVSFKTQVSQEPSGYQVAIQNHVQIEKPWFALGFLFKPMSTSITEDKFVIARDRLIHYLLSESDL